MRKLLLASLVALGACAASRPSAAPPSSPEVACPRTCQAQLERCAALSTDDQTSTECMPREQACVEACFQVATAPAPTTD